MSGRRKKPTDQNAAWFAPHVERQSLESAIELYLDSCYRRQERPHVGEFAMSLGLARPHVSQVLKRVFGKPAREVFRDGQLRRAETLLRDTSMTVDEIARAAGFGTQMTMYRVFRQRLEMTPRGLPETPYQMIVAR
jgi:AraC-like DNA-binding protein